MSRLWVILKIISILPFNRLCLLNLFCLLKKKFNMLWLMADLPGILISRTPRTSSSTWWSKSVNLSNHVRWCSQSSNAQKSNAVQILGFISLNEPFSYIFHFQTGGTLKWVCKFSETWISDLFQNLLTSLSSPKVLNFHVWHPTCICQQM